MEMDHQQEQGKTMMEIDDQDRLSELPNSILTLILSSLRIREAVRTSAIAKRYRHIWRTTPTTLVLDADNMLDRGKYSDINVYHMECMERSLIKMKRTVIFMENVNHYLDCLSEVENIEKLKVCFTFRHNMFRHNLTRWIRFALARNVEEMELCLFEEDHFSAPVDGQLYVFPCDPFVSSCLKRLRLAHCVLAPQWSIFSGFSAITTLELSSVDLVSVGHIQNLLKNCHNLEYLSLTKCGHMEYLRIEHPSCQRLRYLNVDDCPHLKAIHLNRMNVETLEYKGRIIEFLFMNSPRLRTAFNHVCDWRLVFSDMWPLTRLPLDLPQLETLFLESSCHMTGVMHFPTFPNLQRLIILKSAIVQHDLSWITTFLKACPTLQRLELHLRTYYYVEEELRDINWPPRCPHDQLNEILITGMHGYLTEIETAIYLLKNATSLQKMTIDPRPRLYIGNGKWHLLEASERWTRIGKHKVDHHLTQQLSLCPPVELLIL